MLNWNLCLSAKNKLRLMHTHFYFILSLIVGSKINELFKPFKYPTGFSTKN